MLWNLTNQGLWHRVVVTSIQFIVSKISSLISTLSIMASNRELAPIEAALREICWEGGVMSVGVNPSDSPRQKRAKKERTSR